MVDFHTFGLDTKFQDREAVVTIGDAGQLGKKRVVFRRFPGEEAVCQTRLFDSTLRCQGVSEALAFVGGRLVLRSRSILDQSRVASQWGEKLSYRSRRNSVSASTFEPLISDASSRHAFISVPP